MTKVFRTERHKAMCMSAIRDLKDKGLSKKQIYAHICKEFNIKPHKRTCDHWVDGVKYSHKTARDELFRKRWVLEYKPDTVEEDAGLKLLEEMYDSARSRGLIQ